tara:strand:+ start:9781 stop:10821 length:1041 start_codon:yes stop_codon:yes gene_type:complete
MGVEFRPAAIDGVALFIAVAGASRSGKTFTALRLARGIAGPRGKIAAIDTEAKRMSHYKNDFLDADGRPFNVWNMTAPFSPERFLDGAKRAQATGHDVLVIDSFSLEWVGEGGVLDWHDREVDAAVKRAMSRSGETRSEYQIREAAKMAGWIKPKSAHKAMMTGFLQLTMPVIFCLRAEDKVKPAPSGGQPVKLGWVPTQDPRFIYEWTVSVTLHPETPGKMRYDLPHKVEGQHRQLFPEGRLIGEDAGRALHAWANSDAKAKAPEPPQARATGEGEDKPRTLRDAAEQLQARVREAATVAALDAVLGEPETGRIVAALTERGPEQARALNDLVAAKMTELHAAAA